VNVTNVSASINGVNSVCAGSSTIINAVGGGSYLWDTGATTASISVTPSSPSSTYIVTVTNSGCTATATKTISVGTISANVTGKNSICEGPSTTLTATGGTA
jgi:hypothetical protein